MAYRQSERIKKIRKQYGASAFSRWGKKGGSPILKAWSQGKIPRSLVKGSR
jgi:hypothetical protein